MAGRTISSIGLVATVFLLTAAAAAQTPAVHVDHPSLKKLGVQLACQTWSFSDRPLFDTLDLLHEMGFHHVELSPGLTLSKDNSDKVGPDMSAADIDALQAKLKAVHLDVVSYGVADIPEDERSARKIFELAKKLKAKVIVCQPGNEFIQVLDKLAGEFDIKVAILNGPPHTRYADCSALSDAIEDHSHVGVCADLANWKRSGKSPTDCVKELKGHILELHLTDDVPAMPESLQSLKTQGFKGICAVGCTNATGPDLDARFAKSVNAFSDEVTKLAAGK